MLVASALTFLQSLSAEKELFSSLCAYAAIAIASLIAAAAWRQETRPNLCCVCASMVFVAWVVARALTSPVPYVARPDLYCVLAALTLYGLTITILAEPGRRTVLITVLLAFAVVHVLISVVQFGLGRNYDLLLPSLARVEPSERASGFYVDPDHLAGLLEVVGVLGLGVAAWSRWPSWSRVLVGYLTAACYLGLALTGSRGGYLSTATSLILFCLLSFATLRTAGAARFLKFGSIGLAVIMAALLIGWLALRGSTVLQRQVNNIVTADRGRIDLWQAAIQQWKLKPIVGTGSGTYLFYGREFRSPQMQSDPVEVHNDYLHLLCEYGILGALTFLVFLGTHIRHGFSAFTQLGPKRIAAGSSLRSNRLALNIGALCAVAAYVVHSAVDFNLHIPANALLLAFVFGLLANPGLEHCAERLVSRLSPNFPRRIGCVPRLQCIRLLAGGILTETTRTALRDEDPSQAAVQFSGGSAELARRTIPYLPLPWSRLLRWPNEPEHSAERAASFSARPAKHSTGPPPRTARRQPIRWRWRYFTTSSVVSPKRKDV